MSKKTLDDSVCKIMADLCQKLTHTGQKYLDQKCLKKFEDLCKKSDAHMDLSFHLLMGQMEKKHAEVRYSALLVCDQLFRTQSLFRERLVEDLHNLMQLTVGTCPEHPLPPPKPAAKALRHRALQAISDWHHDFKLWHVQLESAYEFLRDCLNVDFTSIEQQRLLETTRKQNERKRLEMKENELLAKTLKEMKEHFEECSTSVAALQSCISLLVPPPDNFLSADISEQGGNPEDAEDIEMRENGMIDPKQSFTLTIKSTPSKLKITEDNIAIVENAKDMYKQVSKQYLPMVKFWVKALSQKATSDAAVRGQLLAVQELLGQMQIATRQCTQLGLHSNTAAVEDSDSDEMEEVAPKEGYEAQVQDTMLAEMLRERESRLPAPMQPQPGSSRPRSPPKPLQPTSIDDWQKLQLPTPHVVMGMKLENHQVWLSASALESEEPVVPTLSTCPINFERQFEPVKWACRALLPSGKLCPRMDRFKCPLHGAVVPRDTSGRCSRPEEAEAEAQRQEQLSNDWQNPKLLAQLKESTGIDLKMPEKGKRRKKTPEFPGLTNIKKKNDTPQTRLAKKIFKRSDMKQLTSPLKLGDKNSREKNDNVLFDDAT